MLFFQGPSSKFELFLPLVCRPSSRITVTATITDDDKSSHSATAYIKVCIT